MESDNIQTQNQPVQPEVRPSVGFPETPRKKSGGFPKWIIAVVGVILILAVGGFFISRSLGSTEEIEPTPTSAGLSSLPTPNVTTTPTPEPVEVDKSEIKVEVLNGTGTAGEATFLQGELEDLGYEEIEVGNASSQNETETTVTISNDMPDEIVDELTEALEDIYDEVTVSRGTVSGGFDIRILTGPRAGASPKASATASPRASATASPTPTASPSN